MCVHVHVYVWVCMIANHLDYYFFGTNMITVWPENLAVYIATAKLKSAKVSYSHTCICIIYIW